jgi:hypothetical protein
MPRIDPTAEALKILKSEGREVRKDMLRGIPYDPVKYAWLNEFLDKIEAIAGGPGIKGRDANLVKVKFTKKVCELD